MPPKRSREPKNKNKGKVQNEPRTQSQGQSRSRSRSQRQSPGQSQSQTPKSSKGKSSTKSTGNNGKVSEKSTKKDSKEMTKGGEADPRSGDGLLRAGTFLACVCAIAIALGKIESNWKSDIQVGIPSIMDWPSALSDSLNTAVCALPKPLSKYICRTVDDSIAYQQLFDGLNDKFASDNQLAVDMVLRAAKKALLGKAQCSRMSKSGFTPTSLLIAGKYSTAKEAFLDMIQTRGFPSRSKRLVLTAPGQGSAVDRVRDFLGEPGEYDRDARVIIVKDALKYGDGIYNIEPLIEKGRCFTRPMLVIVEARFEPPGGHLDTTRAVTQALAKASTPQFGGRHAFTGRLQHMALFK